MRLIDKILGFIKNYYVEFKYKKIHNYCAKVFRERLVMNNISADEPAEGEDVYISFWKQFHKRVEPYTYRYFYKLLGKEPHIIPEDIAKRYIETVLNPIRYRGFYADKNIFSILFEQSGIIPYTYLYRIMGGALKNKDNLSISYDISAHDLASYIDISVKKLVLKPTINTNSGRGVILFSRKGLIFSNSDGQELSGSFLYSFGSDFVLQEAIDQHIYLKQFSKTSTNTMRIMTYRSIEDDEVQIMAACLRIGRNGSFVDNLFSGGCFVPIDIQTGKLSKELYNRYWQTLYEINDVDFFNNDFYLPFWIEVCKFAKTVALNIPHARLLAQDVIVDEHGKLRLIEFNVDDFDWPMAMTCTKGVPFGDKFDEVIEFCLKHK